jgi:hypothetical protein
MANDPECWDVIIDIKSPICWDQLFPIIYIKIPAYGYSIGI